MSLHSIFSFHVAMKPAAAPVLQEAEVELPREVVSATWKATTEALRASLREKPGSDIEFDLT